MISENNIDKYEYNKEGVAKGVGFQTLECYIIIKIKKMLPTNNDKKNLIESMKKLTK